MALTIVASGVYAPQSGTINRLAPNPLYNGFSGYVITAGMVVGTDPLTGCAVPAMAASGFNYSGAGIALNNASDGQPVFYCIQGLMSLGTTGMTVGQQYALDYATSGGIIANSSLVSGAYVTLLGYCSSSGFITLNIFNTGVQYA